MGKLHEGLTGKMELALGWNDQHAEYRFRLVPQLPGVKVLIVIAA
jgi:hypothetical protein